MVTALSLPHPLACVSSGPGNWNSLHGCAVHTPRRRHPGSHSSSSSLASPLKQFSNLPEPSRLHSLLLLSLRPLQVLFSHTCSDLRERPMKMSPCLFPLPVLILGLQRWQRGGCRARSQFLSSAVEHSGSPSTVVWVGDRGGGTFSSHQSKPRQCLDLGCSVPLSRGWDKGAGGDHKAMALLQPLRLCFRPISRSWVRPGKAKSAAPLSQCPWSTNFWSQEGRSLWRMGPSKTSTLEVVASWDVRARRQAGRGARLPWVHSGPVQGSLPSPQLPGESSPRVSPSMRAVSQLPGAAAGMTGERILSKLLCCTS